MDCPLGRKILRYGIRLGEQATGNEREDVVTLGRGVVVAERKGCVLWSHWYRVQLPINIGAREREL